MAKYYLGSLYRFGYNLECIETNKAKCEQAIMEKYEETFKKRNDGLDPRESFEHQEAGWTDNNDYDYAKECIEWREYEKGKVEWN